MNKTYVLTPTGARIWFAMQYEIMNLKSLVNAQTVELARIKALVLDLQIKQNS